MRSMPAAVIPSASTSVASAARAGDRVEVAGHLDASQRVADEGKARDRRDRDCLERDHRHHELSNSARGAAIRRPSSVSPIRSGRSGPLARAGLGSGQLARARLGDGQLLRPRLRSGLVQAGLRGPRRLGSGGSASLTILRTTLPNCLRSGPVL